MAEHRCVNDLPDAKTLDEGESMECPGCARRLSVVDGKWRRHNPAPVDPDLLPEFGEWLHTRLTDTTAGAKPDPVALLGEYVTLAQQEALRLAPYRHMPRHAARVAHDEARQYW
jgi:hypothetical protein